MGLRMNVKQCVWIVAMILCIGITGSAVRVAASPVPQEQHQDYSRNKNYKTGMRDGRNDIAHNRDHSKRRKFKKDEDRRAYEAGYEAGHQGGSRDHR